MSAKTRNPFNPWPVLASVGLAVMLFLVAAVWNQPRSGQAAGLAQESTAEVAAQVSPATPTPASQAVIKEPTPIPQEWKDNKNQTNGIVLGGVLLVMIIVGGTLGSIMRKDRYPHS